MYAGRMARLCANKLLCCWSTFRSSKNFWIFCCLTLPSDQLFLMTLTINPLAALKVSPIWIPLPDTSLLELKSFALSQILQVTDRRDGHAFAAW